MMTKVELEEFEDWCIKEFHKGNIRSPIHLCNPEQAEPLMEVFKEIKRWDWIFVTYRSHYHCLLKGMPQERLKEWVLNNRSISIFDNKYRIVSSALVGGILPQALGIAMSIKLKQENRKVYVFIGDMTASLGIFYDCFRYAYNNQLPIIFIIEDNGLSTDTPTEESWNVAKGEFKKYFKSLTSFKNIIYYQYKRKYAHYGPELDGQPRVMLT